MMLGWFPLQEASPTSRFMGKYITLPAVCSEGCNVEIACRT